MVLQSIARRICSRLMFNSTQFCQLSTTSVADMTRGDARADKLLQIETAYENAIKALNNLQSNAAAIRQTVTTHTNHKITETIKYMERSGLSQDELDKLSVIHVSGTKGKGSTCAMTESILRAHGIRTGFYSSPHLISVTERIRINGYPICKEKFTKYFWRIYDKMNNNRDSEFDMPAYFNFLTILSFHIFLEEKVDVALLEVGIGGEYDCTNVVRNTKTVGITSLGLEHTALLGHTLQEIAWQKSGIIKPNSHVYTSATQPECLEVIATRAQEKDAKVYKVPDIALYNWPQLDGASNLNKVQKLNASLAIQLANDWMSQNGKMADLNEMSLDISKTVANGLTGSYWPGRCQVIKTNRFNVHLDGAHTVESINLCSDWFHSITLNSHSPKVLIFNTTGDRNAGSLLEILTSKINFKYACFVPNIPFKSGNTTETTVVKVTSNEQLDRAQETWAEWKRLTENQSNSKKLPCVLDAFAYIGGKFADEESVDVLVTGSLHLIGASILALEEYNKCAQNKFIK